MTPRRYTPFPSSGGFYPHMYQHALAHCHYLEASPLYDLDYFLDLLGFTLRSPKLRARLFLWPSLFFTSFLPTHVSFSFISLPICFISLCLYSLTHFTVSNVTCPKRSSLADVKAVLYHSCSYKEFLTT